jgi:hypothetical protein
MKAVERGRENELVYGSNWYFEVEERENSQPKRREMKANDP